jgi:hypothetical protein
MGAAGGVLLFLGSLIYLYVVFTSYSGSITGAWLNAAQFLTPFVAAFAIVGSITLFFVSAGAVAGKAVSDRKAMWLWKYLAVTGMSVLIVAAKTPLFYAAVLGFLLTYLGTMIMRK